MGTVLGILITLDALVLNNDEITNSWIAYKKMMQYVRADPSRYGMDEEKVKQFERLLVSLDQTVLAGAMFQFCVEQDFEQPPLDGDDGVRVDVCDNKVFLSHFFKGVAQRLQHHSAQLGTSTKQTTGVSGWCVCMNICTGVISKYNQIQILRCLRC